MARRLCKWPYNSAKRLLGKFTAFWTYILTFNFFVKAHLSHKIFLLQHDKIGILSTQREVQTNVYMLLSNSSLSLVRLGVDFVLPLSQHEQQEEQQEEQPPPKSTRRKCTTDFGTET